ncbi:hypothetical protein PUN28_019143 [Cardiocondyla obscurior]|uniref:Uncharacterized protein n=1 Tax=Cardiocondyla obscurior TaxID=286306 RepID=A0AAW2EDL4_9HYME
MLTGCPGFLYKKLLNRNVEDNDLLKKKKKKKKKWVGKK